MPIEGFAGVIASERQRGGGRRRSRLRVVLTPRVAVKVTVWDAATVPAAAVNVVEFVAPGHEHRGRDREHRRVVRGDVTRAAAGRRQTDSR